ncbi:U3 small nucleolar RNA-associated protein 18 homolog isoform X2 [Watersipora subatra]|uniref:U3 small nucleolar RNA-associated protein 18 homolog isoform X2 n=1 Tax=Watersipora subatra TaxID=2589382 RepID=UPI00355C7464
MLIQIKPRVERKVTSKVSDAGDDAKTRKKRVPGRKKPEPANFSKDTQTTEHQEGSIADTSVEVHCGPPEDYLATVEKAQQLEELVLGAEDDVLTALSEQTPTAKVKKSKQTSQPCVERKPAWVDDDDAADATSIDIKDSRYRKLAKVGETQISQVEHQKRLKKRFDVVTGGVPAWADLSLMDSAKRHQSDDEEEEERELTRKTGDYINKSSLTLSPTYLEYKTVTHANKAQPHKAPVSTVRFHPTSQVIMTASKDQNLSFFQVDGKTNPKIQSVFIENFPIYSARFSTDGCRVFLSSKRKSFYEYDMISGQLLSSQPIKGLNDQSMSCFELSPCGKYMAFIGVYGYIYILSTKSKELICTLKMNGSVNCITFSSDGEHLYSFGDDAVVYVWQMRSRECVHRFRDEGCLNGTCISIDSLNHHIVCGSEVGIANIYKATDCLVETEPKPVKVVNNLLTRCTSSRFNSSGQILALASLNTEKSVKLVHMSSGSVYQNFPSTAEKMTYPSDLDFSPNSGYLATGTSKGLVHMYRLQHFSNY